MDSLSSRLKSSFKEKKSMVQIFEELNKEIKMDKLELKNIAPYLSYGLRVKILNHLNDYTGKEFSEINGYYFIGKSLHITYNGGNTGKSISEFKPILRPMSDLTKEITHNGETFVPLKRITKEYYDKDNETIFSDESLYKIVDNKYCYPSNGERTSHWWLQYEPSMMAFDNQEIEGCLPQYELLQELFKYHFDVNDLIGRGLAINLNEVNNETVA